MNHKFASLSVCILSGSFVALAVLLVQGRSIAPAQADPMVLYVAPAGSCAEASGLCYSVIQDAVDAAAPGDEIRIATGVYTDVNVRPRIDVTTTGVITQIVYLTKTLTLRGGYTTTNWITSDVAANPTVLDAQDQGRVMYIAGDITVSLEGLRLTRGTGNMPGLYLSGGGVFGFTATAMLSGCQIDHNTATAGGGLAFSNGQITLNANSIHDNVAGYSGGGVLLDSGHTVLKANSIVSNTANYADGGGLYIAADEAVLIGNLIQGNASKGTDYKFMHGGGGIFLASSATLNSNVIQSNTTKLSGGGVYILGSAPTLKDNFISGNNASGLYATLDTALVSGNIITGNAGDGIDLIRSEGTLLNNVIAANQASGIYIAGGTPQLLFNSIAGNGGSDGIGIFASTYTVSGGRVYSSTIALTNTILVNHSVGISVTTGNTVTVNGILWYATPITISSATSTTLLAQNQVYGDPAFAADGYHLTAASAAISVGVPASLWPDIDHQPRRDPPEVGVDEYWAPGTLTQVYLPLLLR